MSLARIDRSKGRYSATQCASIEANIIGSVCGSGSPEQDSFQKLADKEVDKSVYCNPYLRIWRLDGFVRSPIMRDGGRTLEQERSFYKAVAYSVIDRAGTRPDMFSNLIEVTKKGLSFVTGNARYA